MYSIICNVIECLCNENRRFFAEEPHFYERKS